MGWWPFRRRYKPPVYREPLLVRLFRMILHVVALVVLLGITGGAIWFGINFYHFMLHSDYFQVRDITVDIASEPQTGDEAKVEKLVQYELQRSKIQDMNLLKVNEADLRKKLEAIPKIRRAEVRKVYPSLLVVSVEQREMRALVLQDGIYSVDTEGVVLESLSTRDPKASRYPYISGLDVGRLEPGMKIQSESLTKSIALLTCLKEQAPALFDKISDVRCDKELNQTLFLKGGVEIRFGREEPRKRMPALETFLSKMGPAEDYEYIDLRFEKQVTAMPKRVKTP